VRCTRQSAVHVRASFAASLLTRKALRLCGGNALQQTGGGERSAASMSLPALVFM
jgi:hypothetical protein